METAGKSPLPPAAASTLIKETALPHSRGGGVGRYWLSSTSGKEFYIVEGPRQPLDWEIDALVHAYNGNTPRIKQSVGNFTISQTMKPDYKRLVPLHYRVSER